MINDDLRLTGALTISLNGVIVQKTNNLVVTAGKSWVADSFSMSDEVAQAWS